MHVPDRIGELLLAVLSRESVDELLVLIDMARDDVEVQPLGRLRLAIHEQRQRFRRGVAQPFVDGKPVALGLGDLLALLVEKELVVESFRRRAPERRADLARQLYGIDQVLARHFIIDAERDPAQRPVRLPLALHIAAGNRRLNLLAGVGIDIDDGALGNIALDHRHLQYDARPRRDRPERRTGYAALASERRQAGTHYLGGSAT